METDDDITLVWHGAAHYHIYYEDLRILIDPLYTRLPGDKPHLDVAREDIDRIDYLLLTHGHLDHSWDFPYLVAKHNPEVYAPEACLRDVRREVGRSDAECDETRWHGLGEIKGKTFGVADIEVTPYGIGTEEGRRITCSASASPSTSGSRPGERRCCTSEISRRRWRRRVKSTASMYWRFPTARPTGSGCSSRST